MLLHGLGRSGRYWAGLAPLLASRHTLIAPDLAGFGRSDKPHLDYGSDFHVGTLTSLLDARGLPTTMVAGHSMGGILGAVFAARQPGRVERLAVVASPFPRPQVRPLHLPTTPVRTAIYRAVQGIVPVVAPLVRSRTFPRAVIADHLRHTLESYDRTSHHLLWDPTLAAEVRTLGAQPRPTFLLYSDEDTTIHRDSLGLWRDALPAADARVVPGGHQLLLRGGFAVLAQWFGADAATTGDRSGLQPTRTAV